MKLNYHKIRNIPMEVCTCEQKIAYNLAFRAHISYGDKYQQAVKIGFCCPHDLLYQILQTEFSAYTRQHGGKYDDDAIYSALQSGLSEYLLHPFIASDYEAIGKAFPAHYL